MVVVVEDVVVTTTPAAVPFGENSASHLDLWLSLEKDAGPHGPMLPSATPASPTKVRVFACINPPGFAR
jgi:hypothetical protein